MTVNDEAFELYRAGKYSEALPGLLALEARASTEASFCLAYMYQEGLGVAADREAALKRYRKVGDAGAPVGAFYAGALLEKSGNLTESLMAYRQAATGGYISGSYAIYRLAKNNMLNITRDEAEDNFNRALSGGHLYAKRDFVHKIMSGDRGFIGRLRAIPMFIFGFIEMAILQANDPRSPKLH